MLKTFIEVFNLPKDSDFKMIELENAIIQKYGSIQYFYNEGWKEISDYNEEIIHPDYFDCGTYFEWEDNKISTNSENKEKYTTREKALMGLCLDNKQKFKGLVRKIYEI